MTHYAMGNRPDDPGRNGDGDGAVWAYPTREAAEAGIEKQRRFDGGQDVSGLEIIRHDRPMDECTWCQTPED